MRVRTSRRTGCPTASHMRRTCRLRPSWITDLDRRVVAARLHEPHLRPARVGPSSSSTPSRSARSAPRLGHALDLGEVLLLDAVARMREQLRELAVVGEDQQALGVAVEPADREHARLVGHEVEHGRAALRVASRSSRCRAGLLSR